MRFITDNTRLEKGDDGVARWNPNAGYEIIKYIRQGFTEIPILVFTSSNATTAYIKEFTGVTATTTWWVVRAFLQELASEFNSRVDR